MATTAKSEWKHPMVVDGESLTKIEKLLKSKVGQPTISASCTDNTDHEFTSVNTLLKYENSKRSRIESIRFRAVKEGDWSKQARVTFTPNEFRTLDIEVTGTQETAPRLRDDISVVAEGMKAWYWPLYKVDFVNLLFAAFLLLWLVANIVVRVRSGSLFVKSEGTDQSTGMLLAFALFGLGLTIHTFRNRLFPRMTFLIGQESGRHATLDKIQWGVVVSFGVSFFASLVFFMLT